MRIPTGDLAPARRRRRRGGFGSRRRGRLRRALPVLLVAAVGAAGTWGVQRVRSDDAPSAQRPVVASTEACATASPSSALRLVLPPPRDVRFRLLNGTERDGLGRTVATALAQRGFAVTETGNAGRRLGGASRVYHGPGGAPAAQAVAIHVIGAELVPVPSAPRGAVDLVLGSGFTRLRTDAEAREFTSRVLRRTNGGAPAAAAGPCA